MDGVPRYPQIPRATGKPFGFVKRDGRTYVDLALEQAAMAVARRQ